MKILFIGNSHTFFNDMPEMLHLFGQARGIDIDSVQNTAGGRGLDWQAAQFDVRYNVLFGRYDYIVLQHIAHPFPGRENLLEGAGLLMPFLERSGAKLVAYLPWSEKALPERQAEITEAHRALIAQYPEMLLAPVGLVWDDLRHSHPEIELYFRDGEHASPLGSYLIAATIFRLLTGQRTEGLPFTLEMGRPTFAGLTFLSATKWQQDFGGPTAYALDPVACLRITQAVDRLTPGN
ncbi:MAG: SGNH/GDSL hydrolase family protein [Clostridiales bacterium]|nr:SGNH/GDSL hydrolase family protein [Clostridiales bacterium]